MPDKKNNNNKKGGNGGGSSLRGNLVSAARKRQREEDADNERDPAGPAGQVVPTTTTTAAPGSNASTSLVPNVPDVMHLTRNHVQANISRRGNILGLSNTLNPLSNTDFFVADSQAREMLSVVHSEAGFAPLASHWTDLNGGHFPPTLVALRRNNASARRNARRHIDQQHVPALPEPEPEPMDTESSKKEPGPNSKRQKTEKEPKPKGPKGKKKPCAWCKKPGHEVKDCPGPPGPDGFIRACSLHNLTSHTLEDCNAAKEWDRQTWWIHLVYNRSGLPPLAANEPWEELAYDYIVRGSTNMPVRDDHPLPFTAEFSKTIEKKKFDQFDFNADKHGQLGIEDCTSTAAKFKEWCNALEKQKQQQQQEELDLKKKQVQEQLAANNIGGPSKAPGEGNMDIDSGNPEPAKSSLTEDDFIDYSDDDLEVRSHPDSYSGVKQDMNC